MIKGQALTLLHSKMQSQNLRRHCYAVAAVIKALAKRFGENESKWETVGLLHDGDYEETKTTPEKHTVLMAEWLKEIGETDKEILDAILSHNFSHTGQNPPKNKLEWSLFCCDELTGLIVAVTLVRPEKKLSKVTVENILSKWNSKSFAAGVKREQIEMCEEKLGIKLPDFITISLKAMQGISSELGL
ncbi:MAG: HDIG domain-containing protein [Candidatus Woesebacteria bacterium]|nr:HDIG domain-containing protein [Candidatus Woesebacteria bacterium]